MATTRSLTTIRRRLDEHYGAAEGPEIDDPFALILWEQVAYLVDDAKRHDAFLLLDSRVGLSPQAILAANHETLAAIAASGGTTASDKRADYDWLIGLHRLLRRHGKEVCRRAQPENAHGARWRRSVRTTRKAGDRDTGPLSRDS